MGITLPCKDSLHAKEARSLGCWLLGRESPTKWKIHQQLYLRQNFKKARRSKYLIMADRYMSVAVLVSLVVGIAALIVLYGGYWKKVAIVWRKGKRVGVS
jgi:hypothetical protein